MELKNFSVIVSYIKVKVVSLQRGIKTCAL